MANFYGGIMDILENVNILLMVGLMKLLSNDQSLVELVENRPEK